MGESDSSDWIVTAEGDENGLVTYCFGTKAEAFIKAAGLRAKGYQKVTVQRGATESDRH
jgi:hypothetical protein